MAIVLIILIFTVLIAIGIGLYFYFTSFSDPASPVPTGTLEPDDKGYKTIVHSLDNQCLDYFTGNGNSFIAGCNGGMFQKWLTDSNGTIKHGHSGKCLDYYKGNAGDAPFVNDCNGGEFQRWTVPSKGPGRLVHNNSGKCMDYISGTNAIMTDCINSNTQQWKIDK
jgi:serine/threonine-protein kinase